MFDSEYSRYDGLGLAELIERGDVAASEVLDQALERADRVNPALGALIYDMRDEARRYLRHELVPGAPFAGAPYVLKDIRSMYAGTPTTAGSRFFAEGTADHDSEVVARLRRAGMAVFAKTNTPELGLNQATEPALYGPTRNPWDLSLIPGGSSGGSAAAVAGGIVPWADASDGGGSIRIPASCCGLFGLKPTRGRTPSGPKAGEGWDGLTTQLTVTRTVRDTAAILDVIAGPDTGAPYYAATDDGSYLEDANRDPGKLRIAFTTSALSDVPIDEGWVQATRATATLLEELGHAVEEAWPRYDWQAMDRAYRTVVDVNLAATIAIRSARLGREPAPDALEPCTRSRVEFGRAVSGPTYAHALGTLLRVGRQVGSFFKNIDVFLTPTLTGPPPKIGTFDTRNTDVDEFRRALGRFSPWCSLANVTGQPAMSVPLHHSDAGLPIGMQFFGTYGDEHTLFQLAGQLDRALPWDGRRPEIAALD